jgi:hypothetical protein
MTFKLIKKIGLTILVLLLVWHVVWLGNYYAYYDLSDGYQRHYINMVRFEKDYTYTLQCPRYPSFVGNFALSNNDNILIIVWPGLFVNESYTYGLEIYDEDIDQTYRIYVDSELNYLDIRENKLTNEERTMAYMLLSKYDDALTTMKQLVETEWGIR